MSGSGHDPFVSVNSGEIDISSMKNTILDTFEYARRIADEALLMVNTSYSNLHNVLGNYNPTISSISIPVPSIDGPAFPEKPNFLPLELDESWPSTFIPDANLMEYGVMDFDFVTPTLPKELDEGFSFTPGTYSSEMWTALFAKVHGHILSGSYGLPADVHNALVAIEQEARRLNQDREWRAGLATAGAMGWNLSGGHMMAFVSEFQSEVLKRDQDALNNITGKNFDITNANQNFFVTSGIDLEKSWRAAFEAAEARGLEVAKAVKDYLAKFREVNILLYKAQWEGIAKKLEALSLKITAIKDRNRGEQDICISRAQILESQIKAITEKNRGKVDVRKGEAEVYGIEVGAIKEAYIALVEEAKLIQNKVSIEINREIEIEKLKLSAFSDKAKLALSVADGGARVGSQIAASALGAINTSLSSGYSGNEGKSETTNVSAHINSSHNYQEE